MHYSVRSVISSRSDALKSVFFFYCISCPKCAKTHQRACDMSKNFPGVIPPDPRSQGEGEGGPRKGREGREGREGEGEGGGEEGEGRGRERVRVEGIWPPILKSWIRHYPETDIHTWGPFHFLYTYNFRQPYWILG
jgi:hypothetical protein